MIIFDSEDNNPFDFLCDTNDGMMKRLNLPLRWIRQMTQIRFWREADRAMLSTGNAMCAAVMALYLTMQVSVQSIKHI